MIEDVDYFSLRFALVTKVSEGTICFHNYNRRWYPRSPDTLGTLSTGISLMFILHDVLFRVAYLYVHVLINYYL